MILKQVISALEPLREALKASPDNEKAQNLLAEALYRAGLIHAENGKYQEEIDVLREAVFSNPTHYMVHYQLGRAYDSIRMGQKAVVHTIIAKQYFAENYDDELLRKTIRLLQRYCQKYDLKPENFAKVEGRSINRARRFYLRSLNNRIRSVKAFDRPASDSFLTWPLNSFSFLKPSSILISSVSKFSGVRTRVPGANCN